MKQKILLVDDDKELVEAYRILLEAVGYEVECAHDGQTGLKKMREFLPNLIILDVMMTTKTEGLLVSREIAKMPELRGVPVIMVTGVRRAMDVPFPLEPDEDYLPVKAVLEKPVRPDELLAKVESALQKAAEHGEP